MAVSRGKRRYDVAISFAGEDRKLAVALANALKHNDVKVFYDEFEKSTLWGKDLYQYLQRIYKDYARYCIVLVSRHYLKKRWTRHELRSAQARAFAQNKEYILPIKLDTAELPGLNSTTGYIEAAESDIRDIVDIIREKLGRSAIDLSSTLRRKWDGEFVVYNGARMVSYWPEMIKRAQAQTTLTFVRELERIPYGKEQRYRRGKLPRNCHDCAVSLGKYHVLSCDMEECANCGDQLLSCDCATTDDYTRVPRAG